MGTMVNFPGLTPPLHRPHVIMKLTRGGARKEWVHASFSNGRCRYCGVEINSRNTTVKKVSVVSRLLRRIILPAGSTVPVYAGYYYAICVMSRLSPPSRL